MKLLIFSDSHRVTGPMLKAIEREKPDSVIHLGDVTADADAIKMKYPRLPVSSVVGNCDLYTGGMGKTRLTFTIEGKRFFITHGHTYHVKYTYDALINAAMVERADVCLFGHTHVPYSELVNGMLVINPGTVGMGAKTYCAMEISGGEITYEIKNV